jgi:hypothetical protein
MDFRKKELLTDKIYLILRKNLNDEEFDKLYKNIQYLPYDYLKLTLKKEIDNKCCQIKFEKIN